MRRSHSSSPSDNRGINRKSTKIVTVLSSAIALSVLASGCSATLDSASTPSSGKPSWNPQDVPALGVSSQDANQPTVPLYEYSTVTETQGLATSLQPTLQSNNLTAGVETSFSIWTVGGTQSQNLWSDDAPTNSIIVPAGVLEQGGIYAWQASQNGATETPNIMMVDAQRSGLQPTENFGAFGVDLAAGTLTTSASLRAVPGPSGNLGIKLGYASGQPTSAGLPPGWLLGARDQMWSYLTVLPNDAVALVAPSGMLTAYTWNGGGYTPVSPAGREQPTGSAPTLARNVDPNSGETTWTATSMQGQTWTFGPANSDGQAFMTSSYNGTTAQPTYTLTNGKITKIADAIAPGLTVDLTYEDTGTCPSPPDGFISAPTGLLCQVTYPDGSTTNLHYLAGSNNQPLLGRIVDYPDTSDSVARVTDYGYDQSNRMISNRAPMAANVQQAGTRTDTAALISSVTYDSAGRVATVTKPAASAGDPQPSYTITYNPANGQATVAYNPANGQPPATTTGYVSNYTYDQATMLQLTATDSTGATSTKTWNTSIDQLQTTVDPAQLTTQFTYDSLGRTTKQQGPFPNGTPGTNTPFESYTYDQDVSQPTPTPLLGFDVTYWSGTTLTGPPAGRATGPEFNNQVPSLAQLSWSDSPVPNASSWSARLNGVFTVGSSSEASKSGKSKQKQQKVKDSPQSYGFAISSGAQLWVDNVQCQSTCTIPLADGQHQLRIDYSTSNTDGSVNLQWQPPGGSMGSMPMSEISPGYGLRSITTKNDATSTGATGDSQLYTEFGDPWTSKQTQAWAALAPEMKGSWDYEPYDPSQQTFGRRLSQTDPAGNAVTYEYYGAEDTAKGSSSCDLPSYTQWGRQKSVTRGGLTYTNYFDDFGRSVSADIGGAFVGCSSYNDAGELVQQVTEPRAEDPGSTTQLYSFVGNDPLVGQQVVTVGNFTYTTTTTTDLYAQPVSVVTSVVDSTNPSNQWGSNVKTTYDPYLGKPLSVNTTITSGPNSTAVKSSTATNVYNSDGQLTSVSLDGKTVATVVPATATGSTVTYGNGVVQQLAPNEVGEFGSQTWTTSDQQTFYFDTNVAPTQRILSEDYAFAADEPNATVSYTYDNVGRLTNADLKTTLPVTHKNWQYQFGTATLGTAPNAGLNSNRTKQIVDNTTETDYGYDSQDRLTNTTNPTIGNNISYTGWGEMSQLGTLELTYDGGGNVTKILDSASKDQITYNRSGQVIVEKIEQTAGGSPVHSRYAAGGFVLDANNQPQWQVVSLPGGAHLIRDMTGDEQWQHQTGRGQLMWVSDSTGKELPGNRHLYSPFGEEIMNNATQPKPAKGGKAQTQPSTPAQPVNSPAASQVASASPSAAASDQAAKLTPSTRPQASASRATASASRATASAQTPTAPPTSAAPSTTPPTQTPTPSPSTTTAPTPTDDADVPAPNLQWQAGNDLESNSIGGLTLISMGARLYVAELGRFTSVDGTIFGSANAYDYANQDPINQSDPNGTMAGWVKKLLGFVVPIVSTVVGLALMAGMKACGFGWTAVTPLGRLGNIVGSQIIAAGLSWADDALDAKISGTSGFQSTLNSVMSMVDISLAGVMGKAEAAGSMLYNKVSDVLAEGKTILQRIVPATVTAAESAATGVAADTAATAATDVAGTVATAEAAGTSRAVTATSTAVQSSIRTPAELLAARAARLAQGPPPPVVAASSSDTDDDDWDILLDFSRMGLGDD